MEKVPGGESAEDGSADSSESGQVDGFAEEVASDVAPGGAECPAKPDLRAASQDGDDHSVSDADAADEQRDAAECEKQRGEGLVRGGPRGESVGRTADGDLLR